MPFSLGSPGPASNRFQRRRVPDYFSASMRWRLLGAAALVLLGLSVASRLADPRVRELLGLAPRPIAGGAPLTDAERFEGRPDEIDTRLVERSPDDEATVAVEAAPRAPAVPPGGDPPGKSPPEKSSPATSPVGESSGETSSSATTGPSVDPLIETWRDAWSALLRDLDVRDEAQLYERLRAARGWKRPRPFDSPDLSAWEARRSRWAAEWTRYVTDAKTALEPLPADERDRWTALLDQVAASWERVWSPLLADLGERPADTAELRELTTLLQEAADRRALGAILDDTVWRGSETNVWFRLVERLQESTPAQLRRDSAGPTGYLPLFKQATYYRGRLVTIRGVVRMAYRVDAPRNDFGVSEYVLLWIHPAGGPDSPLVVYALETPPGFPPVRHRDRDQGTTTLHEEVEVTGYFFKRWAYEARGGIHVAPLLVAHSPAWQAPVDASGSGPSALTIAAIVAGALTIGVGAAVWAYWNTKSA